MIFYSIRDIFVLIPAYFLGFVTVLVDDVDGVADAEAEAVAVVAAAAGVAGLVFVFAAELVAGNVVFIFVFEVALVAVVVEVLVLFRIEDIGDVASVGVDVVFDLLLLLTLFILLLELL